MHCIYRASLRIGGNSRMEWYWDTRAEAATYLNDAIRERKRRGEYCGAARIEAVPVAACETAYDYNYPYIPRIISERRKAHEAVRD